MKETTIVVLVGMVLTAGLIALGQVPGEAWQWVAGAGVAGKAVQGAADRFGARGVKPRGPSN